jgi:hypothetical protein
VELFAVLSAFTVIIMLVLAYVFFREGLFTALTMAFNLLIAGVVAFNFFEPMASMAEPFLQNTFLEGYEDPFFMVSLFCGTLALLRFCTNSMANCVVDYHPALNQGGAVVVALLTGYLLSGFLVCMLQTLPWQVDFLGFDHKVDAQSAGKARRFFPPDRVWLAAMRRIGTGRLGYPEGPSFDPTGSFSLRYAQLRRYKSSPPKEAAPLPAGGSGGKT